MDGLNFAGDSVSPLPEAVGVEGVSDPSDPFRGDSQRFEWTRELEVGQLQDEIADALGPNLSLAVIHSFDEAGTILPVSAQHPVTVYVTPSSADLAAVRKVMAAHRPDPYYGMTEEQKAQAQLREKIAANGALTPEEVQMALRMLIA